MTTTEGQTPTPPIAEVVLPPTMEECEDEIGRLTEDLDPISAYSVLITVCDALDLDPLETMMKIKMEHRLTEQESIIDDLLQMSQSNERKSTDLLYRAAALEAHRSHLDDQMIAARHQHSVSGPHLDQV